MRDVHELLKQDAIAYAIAYRKLHGKFPDVIVVPDDRVPGCPEMQVTVNPVGDAQWLYILGDPAVTIPLMTESDARREYGNR